MVAACGTGDGGWDQGWGGQSRGGARAGFVRAVPGAFSPLAVPGRRRGQWSPPPSPPTRWVAGSGEGNKLHTWFFTSRSLHMPHDPLNSQPMVSTPSVYSPETASSARSGSPPKLASATSPVLRPIYSISSHHVFFSILSPRSQAQEGCQEVSRDVWF